MVKPRFKRRKRNILSHERIGNSCNRMEIDRSRRNIHSWERHMHLLKPTSWKIFLAVALGVIGIFYTLYFLSFFGCTLVRYTLPNIPGQPLLTPLQVISQTLIYGGPGALVCLAFSSNYYWLIISFIFLFPFVIVSYLISCVIIFFITKLRKQQGENKK